MKRVLASTVVCWSTLTLSGSSLLAQRSASTFDGVWHEVAVHIERPDSTLDRPGSDGVFMILNGHFSQIWLPPAAPGVQQQAKALTTAEEKAARYDQLTANAGVFQVRDDSTFTGRYEHAKSPAAVGRTFTVRYRYAGDTLWQITTSRWAKDTTKMVRTTHKYVREK